jgi:ATP-binding cassette subfamily B protein
MKISAKKYLKLFSKYLKPQLPQIIILAILLGISVGINLLNPQILGRFIDMAEEGDSSRSLTIAALIFIGAAVLQQLIVIATTYVSQNVGWATTNSLRADLVRHCLHLDMSFHKSHQPGELIERLDSDVTALFNFFSKLFLNVFNNMILLAGIIILLFREDWRIGLGLSIFAVIAIIILWKIESYAVPNWVEARKIEAKFFGFIGEQITSTEDTKSSGAISYVMYRFFQFLREWYPIRKKASMMYCLMWTTTLSMFALGYAVAFGIGGYLWQKGIISIGTVYLIINYTDLMSRPIEQIRTQLEELQKAGASIIRIEELFSLQSKLIDGNEAIIAEGPLFVEVENLNFEYDADAPVLNHVSFKLKPGKTLGLLGRTGSGKTTLARLIVRLYDPTQGVVKLGGQRLCSLRLTDLRNRIAYVTQDVQLFHATVRDNLSFFNPYISDESILSAIDNMGLTEWFKKLNDGLDTMLDANGGGLSAGEAQLLAFVRVFLRNPDLVILDEASSRLDPITEQLMENAISRLLTNRTCIMIAHRLCTVQRADEILILDNGSVLEYGSREALSKDLNSHFHQLLQTGLEEVLV